MNQKIVHDGNICKKRKFTFFHLWLTREGWLIRRYLLLKSAGPRYIPAVFIKGEDGLLGIKKPPIMPNGFWLLEDNIAVSTRDIIELDSARWLAGYSF